MEFFLGIDGGGTKTKAVLLDRDKNRLGEFIGGPMNYQVIKGSGVRDRILEAAKFLGADLEKTSVGVGVAGAGRENEIREIENLLAESGVKNFKVSNDAHIALLGAHNGEDGAFLISGTGSIGYVLNSEKVSRVGGFGHLLGDEGSGYWIGMTLLKKLFKGSDRRGRYSEILMEKVLETLNLHSRDELLKWVYTNTEKGKIASLARIVFDNIGEPMAQEITEEAAEDLKELIRTLKGASETMKISFGGGIIENPTPVKKLLIEKLSEIQGIEVKEREYPAEYGAILLWDKDFYKR